MHHESNTVEYLITFTSAQRPPLNLWPVKKVPAKLWSNPKKKIHTVVTSNQQPNGHIIPISNFTAISGQADNPLQTNERKNKKNCFFI